MAHVVDAPPPTPIEPVTEILHGVEIHGDAIEPLRPAEGATYNQFVVRLAAL